MVHIVRRTKRLHKGLAHIGKRSAAIRHDDGTAAMGIYNALQLVTDIGKRLFPGHLAPLSLAALTHPQKRGRGTLFVVTLGKGSSAFGAEALAHGSVIGIAFHPNGNAIFDLDTDGAADSTHTANRMFNLFHNIRITLFRFRLAHELNSCRP